MQLLLRTLLDFLLLRKHDSEVSTSSFGSVGLQTYFARMQHNLVDEVCGACEMKRVSSGEWAANERLNVPGLLPM